MLISTKITGNISAELQVFSYTWRDVQQAFLLSVIVGDAANPIAGNGLYALNIYQNGQPVVPGTQMQVPAGQTQVIFPARSLLLSTNDVVTVGLIGLAADASVDVVTELLTNGPPQGVSFAADGSVAQLEAIRTNIIAKLADLEYYLPSTNVDGQGVQTTEYRKGLQDELAMIEERIRRANSDNVPPTTVAYANSWRKSYSRSPYLGGP